MSDAPVYHGVFSERVVTLSPLKPEIGIGVNSLIPIDTAKRR